MKQAPVRAHGRCAVTRRRFLRMPVLAGILAGTLALAGAAALIWPGGFAQANDTMVGGVGGVVYPLASTDIRMEAETVQAICYRWFAEYRVDFKFANDGEAQTVDLGFPFRLTESGDYGEAPAGFRAWQDGKPLDVEVGRGVSGDELSGAMEPPDLAYYLHKATFPHGTTMITVSYLAEPTVEAGGRFLEAAPSDLGQASGWAACYEYWLHTGAGWKGKIGTSIVRFRLADSFKGWGVDIKAADKQYGFGQWTTRPETYAKPDDRGYQWVYRNYEPDQEDDVLLGFTRPNLLGADPTLPAPAAYGAFPEVDGVSRQVGRTGGSGADEWPVGFEAIDGSLQTAWGAPNPGIGEWLQLALTGDNRIKEVRILPGRNDSPASFGKYGRPKTLKAIFSDGTVTTMRLKDEPSLQRFPVSTAATSVRFQIVDIYPGTMSNDTYISEIDFGNTPAPQFDTFANMIAEGTPPSTEAPLPLGDVANATASGMTIGSASGATGNSTGAAAPASTVRTLPTLGEVAGTHSGRLLWPGYVGLALAVVGLGAVLYLAGELRRRRRGTGD